MCQLPVPNDPKACLVEADSTTVQERQSSTLSSWPFWVLLRNGRFSAEVLCSDRVLTDRVGRMHVLLQLQIDTLAQSIPYQTRFKDFTVSGGGNDWDATEDRRGEIERCLPMQDEFMTNVCFR